MSVLKIIELGESDVLHAHCAKVEAFDGALHRLLDDMADTMSDGDGAGLAAPQVGKSLRACVIDAGEGVIELVNPEIVSTEGQVTAIEACLSVPGRAGRVVRPEKVTVRAQDRNGETFEMHGEGMLAVCLCHEIDHLDGIVYVDKMIEDTSDQYQMQPRGDGQ